MALCSPVTEHVLHLYLISANIKILAFQLDMQYKKQIVAVLQLYPDFEREKRAQ